MVWCRLYYIARGHLHFHLNVCVSMNQAPLKFALCGAVNALIGLLLNSEALASPYRVRTDDALFAVVTNKAGVAATLAHHHLIAAREFVTSLEYDETALTKSRFVFKTPVKKLTVDPRPLQLQWQNLFLDLGVLPSAFTEASANDREKMTEAMLATDQLDASRYPDVEAEVSMLTAEPGKFGKRTFTHTASVAVTVHGKTVKRIIPARVVHDKGTLEVEAVGQFAFTEFGFKPYSAFLGAVKNKDEFFIFVHFKADKL